MFHQLVVASVLSYAVVCLGSSIMCKSGQDCQKSWLCDWLESELSGVRNGKVRQEQTAVLMSSINHLLYRTFCQEEGYFPWQTSVIELLNRQT